MLPYKEPARLQLPRQVLCEGPALPSASLPSHHDVKKVGR